MFGDDLVTVQALNVGVWLLCAFVVLNAVGIALRMMLDWRKMTATPAVLPVADQFVTHGEINNLELRLTQKLNEQDKRLTDSEERTRQRIHDLADEIHQVKLSQVAMPGLLHKDFESLLAPIYTKLDARDPLLAAMSAKLDVLAEVILPKVKGN